MPSPKLPAQISKETRFCWHSKMPTTKSIHGMWNLDQQYRYPLLFTYHAKNVAGRLKRSAERDSILYAYFLWTLVLKCSSLGWGGKKNVKISHFFLVLLTLNRIEAAICLFCSAYQNTEMHCLPHRSCNEWADSWLARIRKTFLKSWLSFIFFICEFMMLLITEKSLSKFVS